MTRPVFTAIPCPLQSFIAFVLTPGYEAWGAHFAAIQGDDFDEVLAAIPPGVPGWHIYSRDAGYIVAGSEERDRDHAGTPRGPVHEASPAPRESVGRYLVLRRHGEGWGAWRIAYSSESMDIHEPEVQIVDTADSTVGTMAGVDRIIPTLSQLADFEKEIAEWQMEQEALGVPQEVDPAVEARAQVFMSTSSLPDGWESLEVDQLREVVEAAERAIFKSTGKTPADIHRERKETERALKDALVEVRGDNEIESDELEHIAVTMLGCPDGNGEE